MVAHPQASMVLPHRATVRRHRDSMASLRLANTVLLHRDTVLPNRATVLLPRVNTSNLPQVNTARLNRVDIRLSSRVDILHRVVTRHRGEGIRNIRKP